MDDLLDLPPAFADRMRAVHGEDGDAWIAELPAIVARWRERLGLGPLHRLPLSFSFVAAGERRDGTPCVLKLVPPASGHLRDEARWLALAGPGAVPVLADHAAEGALLLAALRPGTTAAALVPERDDGATGLLADALRVGTARTDGLDGLPHLAARLLALDRHLEGPERPALPHATVAEARARADRLLASAGPDVLLHGDLHHGNVLRDEVRGWTVIDPHGLRGDPDSDVGAILYNPTPLGAAVGPLLERRLDRLAARLHRDRERLAGWAFVQAVLSSVWDLGGPDPPSPAALEVVRRLA